MSCFLVFREWFTRALGAKAAAERIVVTTDGKTGALRKIADEAGLAGFEVPDGVGGRFSVLTPVGLLPAALLGIDIRGLLAGRGVPWTAASRVAELIENPAYLGAVLHRVAYAEGRRISVMFAYADQLYLLADWYRQLWAESLGKRCRPRWLRRRGRPHPGEGPGRDRPALAGAALQGRSRRQGLHLPGSGEVPAICADSAGRQGAGRHRVPRGAHAERTPGRRAAGDGGLPVPGRSARDADHLPRGDAAARGGVLPPPGGHDRRGRGAVRRSTRWTSPGSRRESSTPTASWGAPGSRRSAASWRARPPGTPGSSSGAQKFLDLGRTASVP